jgi:hypothetical protein
MDASGNGYCGARLVEMSFLVRHCSCDGGFRALYLSPQTTLGETKSALWPGLLQLGQRCGEAARRRRALGTGNFCENAINPVPVIGYDEVEGPMKVLVARALSKVAPLHAPPK